MVVGQHEGQGLGWCLRWEEEGWEAEERLALAGCPRISEPELGRDGEIVCGHWRPERGAHLGGLCCTLKPGWQGDARARKAAQNRAGGDRGWGHITRREGWHGLPILS